MVYSIEVTNVNSKVFRFQEAECKSTTYNMNTKLLRQSLPDAPPEDAIIINLGRDKNVTVPFMLRVTDDDAANGTHSSTVKTVQEKVDYLLDTFITNGVEDKYTLSITASAASILSIVGILDAFSLNFGSEKPNILPGSLSIAVGGGQQ